MITQDSGKVELGQLSSQRPSGVMVSWSTYYLSMHYDRSKGQLNQRWFGLHSIGRGEAVCCPWFMLFTHSGSLARGQLVADQAAEMQGVKLLPATLTAGLPSSRLHTRPLRGLFVFKHANDELPILKPCPIWSKFAHYITLNKRHMSGLEKSFSLTSANEYRDLELVYDACFTLTSLSPHSIFDVVHPQCWATDTIMIIEV